MSRLDEQYTVSTSHVGLRAAGFLLALLLALGCFGYGINRLVHKDPGYYEIEASPSDLAPLYSSGISLVYLFEGESDQIRAQMNTLKELYSGVLLHSYKLLDTGTSYDGYVNLADLNQDLLEDGRASARVNPELGAVLTDMWEKTREGRGVNLFAGALYREWDGILVLEDISAFDPAVDPDCARRIGDLARETGELDRFSLQLQGDTVTVTVDPAYLAFLKEKEYDAGAILTTGRMTEAYRLDMIRKVLEENGFTNGYLTASSGLTLSLSGHEKGEYVLYGPGDGEAVPYATLEAGGNSACSFLRSFPLAEGEVMYHALEGGGYYHPNFRLETGDFADVLSSSCVLRYDGDIVEACYGNLSLYQLTGREEVEAIPVRQAALACVFRGETEVYTNAPDRLREQK